MELQTFLEAIRKKPFMLRECSFCHTPLYFSFQGDQLGYDDSCDCTSRGGWTPRPEEELEFYLEPSHGWIPKIEAFVKEANELPGS